MTSFIIMPVFNPPICPSINTPLRKFHLHTLLCISVHLKQERDSKWNVILPDMCSSQLLF